MIKKKSTLRQIIRENLINLLEGTSQYVCINEANSCIGGYKLNNLPTIESCEEKCQLFEGIDW